MITLRSMSFDSKEEKPKIRSNSSFKKRVLLDINGESDINKWKKLKNLESEIDHNNKAATKLQKFYKSYRTRRNLADCAVVVEELWWKELDSDALTRSSVSFFNSEKAETAVSRWERASIRAAKLGKGLCKDEKAQQLALRHWLEAIDPRHRYGHNLHLYYEVWFASESAQPFFYWLDIGDGKEVNLEKCPRKDLQRQCIKYLGPKERESYEVVIENGKLVYRQTRVSVNTEEGSKWIFVLSTSRKLYVGEKKKGHFQHSSFLAGGATISSGRVVAIDGILEAIWPFSGHYRPTEENFMEFCNFLEDHQVDLTNVKRYAIDDDIPPNISNKNKSKWDSSAKVEEAIEANGLAQNTTTALVKDDSKGEKEDQKLTQCNNIEEEEGEVFENEKPLSRKIWTTGTGPRISCVRDYPTQLQFHALEQVNLSPKVKPGPSFASWNNNGPVPSPRPSPKVHLSPRLACMGLASPRWNELDSDALTRNSVSFFNTEKTETAVSRWERASIMAAKLGKGLCKDEKAQHLALRHWIEAIDLRHRYGHNLHLYYEVWFASEGAQPFFYWLDIGDGKEINLEKCPRKDLQRQCIKYLGPKEREAYEVVIENGKLVYRQTRVSVNTEEGSKWIFVLSTSRKLYVGEKKKGHFQHSSFLAGGATISSGRVVAVDGILEAIWPFSGHYRPTEENFMEFCNFLEDHQVDLTDVKRYAIDDDIPSNISDKNKSKWDSSDKVEEAIEANRLAQNTTAALVKDDSKGEKEDQKLTQCNNIEEEEEEEEEVFEIEKPLSRKLWTTTGTGSRINCVRDYPTQLQFHALEQVNLSPNKVKPGSSFASWNNNGPVPSPRLPGQFPYINKLIINYRTFSGDDI